jgi:hypothetical protein
MEEHMKIRKESNMFNLANQKKKNPKINKGERKQQTVIKSTRKMANKITGTANILNNNPKCK